jgi:hypothetical protein
MIAFEKRMRLEARSCVDNGENEKSCDATAFVLHKPAFIRCICILPLFFEKPVKCLNKIKGVFIYPGSI